MSFLPTFLLLPLPFIPETNNRIKGTKTSHITYCYMITLCAHGQGSQPPHISNAVLVHKWYLPYACSLCI